MIPQKTPLLPTVFFKTLPVLCGLLVLLAVTAACQTVAVQPAAPEEPDTAQDFLPEGSTPTGQDATLAPASHAGRVLVFDPPNRLFLTDSDGANPAVFTFAQEIHAPALSPDGKSLAYITQVAEMEYALLVMNVSTREATRVSGERFGGFFSKMGWSPDGRKLAFDCAPGTTSISQLCLVDTRTGELSVLTDTARLGASEPFDIVSFGSWKQDGTAICFTLSISPPQGGRHRNTIYTLELASGSTRTVLAGTGDLSPIGSASFSPDGQAIFFDARARENTRVFRVDPDGSHLRPVTAEAYPFQITQPVLSPDGNFFFAYAADQTNQNGMGVPTLFSIDGQLIRQLGAVPGYVVSWAQP